MKKLNFFLVVLCGFLLISHSVYGRGLIQNKGSDTLVNVAQAWAEAYQTVNSNVAVAVTGGGSGTGIAALINGTVDIANASRKMKDKEIKLAEKRGHKPVEFIVGYDALAVYVHHDNPVKSFSIPQLAEIYGEDGEFEKTPCAIGYSGLAYATDHVKLACISKETGGPCVMPSIDSASDGSYPIARPLFMYTNGEPKGETKKYLDWILSDEGQCIILKKGYAPVRPVKCD